MTAACAIPVTTANEEWQQARHQANATAQTHAEWALDLLRSALANEGRDDAQRDRAVVSLTAEFCASALYRLTLSKYQPEVADMVVGSLDRLLPTARNRLLLILSQRVRSRVKELCDLLTPSVPVPAERALGWGKAMSSQILEETWDPDIARQIIEVAPAIRALADTPEQLDETADEYDRLKPDATWDTDTLERHLVAQEFLSTFVSDDALAGTAAAQDIRNAYRQLPIPVRAAGSLAGWTPCRWSWPGESTHSGRSTRRHPQPNAATTCCCGSAANSEPSPRTPRGKKPPTRR